MTAKLRRTRYPNLYTRGGYYYFRMVVPKAYRSHFGKTEVRISLGLCSLHSARLRKEQAALPAGEKLGKHMSDRLHFAAALFLVCSYFGYESVVVEFGRLKKDPAYYATLVLLIERDQQDAQDTAQKAKERQITADIESMVQSCRALVTQNAKFPDKVDFINSFGEREILEGRGGFYYGASVVREGTKPLRQSYRQGKISIRGQVELMNGLGLMVPHTYTCKVNDFMIKDVSLVPGG